jgi:REP element-mobilizing transposase RayT
MPRNRSNEQLPLRPPQSKGWGGRRVGAGRPRRSYPGNPHRARPPLKAAVPLHVTLRLVRGVESLRAPKLWKAVEQAMREGASRFETRVVHFSVMSNHVHMLVESRDRRSLTAAMKGLAVRIARRVNARIGRKGQLIAERYHARPLRTPSEVRKALHYVRHNYRHHLAERGVRLAADWVDPCSSDGIKAYVPLPAAETWLLSKGFERGYWYAPRRLQRADGSAASGDKRRRLPPSA